MLAYLKKGRDLAKWHVVKKEGGKDFYLHLDGTWHPATGLLGKEGFPGLYQTQEDAEKVAASVMNYMVVFERAAGQEKAFLEAEAPRFAMNAFLLNFFGPDGYITNPPPPKWAKVYRSCDVLSLAGAKPLLEWKLNPRRVAKRE